MKTCGKHAGAIVVHLGAFHSDSCPICRVRRRMDDESAKAINESEEQIKKVERANRELLKRIDSLRGAEDNIDLSCHCWECTLLRGIDLLSALSPSMGCCQKSKKT